MGGDNNDINIKRYMYYVPCYTQLTFIYKITFVHNTYKLSHVIVMVCVLFVLPKHICIYVRTLRL